MPHTSDPVTGGVDCQAVLFDLDGVLIDSMELIHRVLRRWATHHGLDPQHVLELSHGRRDVDLVRAAAPRLDAATEARRIAELEVRDVSGLRPLPGAGALLATLPEPRWAVVTSGTRDVARARMRAAGLPLPRILVAAEDVGRGKPAPDGYLRAARDLGAAADQCVVVEDAASGVAAAHAAGMRCLGRGRTAGEDVLHTIEDLRQVTASRTRRGLRLSVARPRT